MAEPQIPDPPYPHGPGRAYGSAEKEVEARQASNFCFYIPFSPTAATYPRQDPNPVLRDGWLADALAATPLPAWILDALLPPAPPPLRRPPLALAERSASATCADLAVVYVFTSVRIEVRTPHSGDSHKGGLSPQPPRKGRRLLAGLLLVFATSGCSGGALLASVGDSMPKFVTPVGADELAPVVTFNGFQLTGQPEFSLGETDALLKPYEDPDKDTFGAVSIGSPGLRTTRAEGRTTGDTDPRSRSDQ